MNLCVCVGGAGRDPSLSHLCLLQPHRGGSLQGHLSLRLCLCPPLLLGLARVRSGVTQGILSFQKARHHFRFS